MSREDTPQAYSFRKTCRICLRQLKTKDKVKILSKTRPDLSKMMVEYLDIKVSAFDKLPSFICHACLTQLNNLQTLRETAKKSDAILKDAINLDVTLKECQTKLEINQCKIENDPQCEVDVKIEEVEDYIDKFSERLDLDSLTKPKIEDIYGECELDDFRSLESFLWLLEREDMVKAAAVCDYTCDICLNKFSSFLGYLDHHKTHEGESLFACEKCSQAFSTKNDLKNHQYTHKVPCPVCRKMIYPWCMKNHATKHTDRFKCNKCGVCVGTRPRLELHDLLAHNEIRDIVCETCGKCFKTKTALWTHNKSHSQLREYRCKFCSYAGRTPNAVYAHTHSMHTTETLVCDVCAKVCHTRRAMYDHKFRYHSKAKMHECTFCAKAFREKSKLTRHLKTHAK